MIWHLNHKYRQNTQIQIITEITARFVLTWIRHSMSILMLQRLKDTLNIFLFFYHLNYKFAW